MNNETKKPDSKKVFKRFEKDDESIKDRLKIEDEISSDVDCFLEDGGTIQEIPQGVVSKRD